MSELTLFPADLAEMSVHQLARLTPRQLHEANANLDHLIAWAAQLHTRFDAALDARYGEAVRATGPDNPHCQFEDGPLRVTAEQPREVTWDQAQLATFAARIAAAGERVEDYLDVHYTIPESRFAAWPSALQTQFSPARAVLSGKPVFRLALVSDSGSEA